MKSEIKNSKIQKIEIQERTKVSWIRSSDIYLSTWIQKDELISLIQGLRMF